MIKQIQAVKKLNVCNIKDLYLVELDEITEYIISSSSLS